MAKKFTSRIVIEVLNDDGTPAEPTNTLTDACSGLTEEQARAHHYALKAAYGEIVREVGSQSMQSFERAVQE